MRQGNLRLLGDAAAMRIGLFPGVELTGQPGRLYEVQATDEGAGSTNWVTLDRMILPTSPFLWFDKSGTTSGPTRIYRSVATE